jgi:hypothetical protein
MFQFVGTNPRTDGVRGPATKVAEHRERIDLHLSIDGERRPIPEVAFRVPKEAYAPASFVGISVIEPRGLMWPIPIPVRLTDTF